MKQILLFDRAMLIRMRIKEVLTSSFVRIIEVENEMELFTSLQKYKNQIDLLIMDIASDAADGFDMVRKIKESDPLLAVVILTASNRRSDFIKVIQAGAADYILKPFDDDFFRSRIINILDNEHELPKRKPVKKSAEEALDEMMEVKPAQRQERGPLDFSHEGTDVHLKKYADEDEIIHQDEIDFNQLLKTEKYKAKKGKYPLTVFALIFDQSNQESKNFSEIHFDDIRSQLWESDEFVHYGPYSFLGILPFCHEPGFERFKEKMNAYLNQEAEEREYYQKYHWHVVGVTIPVEGNDILETDQVIDRLKSKIKEELGNSEKSS